ncbi:branched-chain amino acid aminotransferase [Membranihabitans maritimus]|uniref:branched-chain amino acid aminotransferase n=1 Tax=Membranihabitans maritimus TaxID=2904244 RepID=UPI001F01BA5E|nr:branched-chain amino acid aminotransferase [Membranihabitans maritimus]
MSTIASNFKVTKVSESRLTEVDLKNIPFGRVFTDHMFIAHYAEGQWKDMEIKKLENFSLHPSNLALHYGQSIFEGMKASKNEKGNPLLFRPDEHIKRLNRSAERMCMPLFPEDVFVEALTELVKIDKDWIPDHPGSSLYIRPLMFATDEFLGVAPSETFIFVILLLPVGPYYDKPVKLIADPTYVRAVKGGTGEAKTAGNYAASLYPSKVAKENGFDQILWLDGVEKKFVQEVGTMNIFFVFDDRIVTPKADGAILKGITRKSFIELLKDKGFIVEERPVEIQEVMDKGKSGELKEVFGSGTAAVATTITQINYLDQVIKFDPDKAEIAPWLKENIEDMRNGRKKDPYGWVLEVM